MEAGPPLVRPEVGTAVVTVGVGGVVAVVERIGQTGEERGHRRTSEAYADGRCAGAQRRVVDGVGGKVGVLRPVVVVLAFPHLLAEHGREAVLAQGVGIGDVVLQLPERARPLLHGGGIDAALPAAQVDGGEEAAAAVGAEVIAQFGVPYQVLDGRDLEEEVAVELAAVEPDLVQHRHGDGVGIGEALLRYRRIAAVHVIDGDVGRCGQRVVDDALVAVGELQVVVGGGEVGAQPHLQPGLQLRIQVHAHSQTVELAADDRSLLVHVVGRDVVLHLLRTALCGDLVRVLEGGLEDGVLPVRALPQQRRVGIVLVGRGGIDLSRDLPDLLGDGLHDTSAGRLYFRSLLLLNSIYDRV